MTAVSSSPSMIFMDHYRQMIEARLERILTTSECAAPTLMESMKYSALGGGKRIRPALCLAAAKALGQTEQKALAPACAVELIHAYSLVHDDLPAMDNDELRRGKPTNHVAYGEAMAILAGDGLQTLAFEVLGSADSLNAETRLKMIHELACASGPRGMVAGQAIDLGAVGQPMGQHDLEIMHRHKTGDLIVAAVRIGALTAEDASTEQLEALTLYARALGLAFQVQDDLLDVEGSTDVIGKPQGSDQARGKPTFTSLMGVDRAREYLNQLTRDALRALQSFGDEATPLRAIADYVVKRDH